MNFENSLLTAAILGLIEGLTEFIPVSSTGHLILTGHALGFTGAKADTFEIFIQLGAILAVVVLYLPRFLALLDFRSAAPFSGWHGLGRLALACAPAFVLGALFHELIKARLFAPFPVALALAAGGLLLIWIERRNAAPQVFSIEQLTPLACFLIGCFQCLSLWPGFSRSGSTIVGAMLLGAERRTAAEFSFFVAVPVMCAAVGYDLLKSLHLFSAADLPVLATGFAVSFVTAILAIKFFIAVLNRFTLAPFGYYRLLLAALVLYILR